MKTELKKAKLQRYLEVNAENIAPDLKERIDAAINGIDEATTSSAVGGVMPPFAFSRRGPGNVKAATQLGYKLAKPVNRNTDLSLENQMYSEPAYVTPAQNIEPVDVWADKNGLPQHGDPEMDPGLDGYKQGRLPFTENHFYKKGSKVVEGINGLRYRLQTEAGEVPAQQPAAPQAPAQTAQPQQQQQPAAPNVQVQAYNLQPDFTQFDTKLKDSTEELKTNLQKKIQDQILNKKIVVRASKGFKQPETDYTINVTGVNIDYYYDRYVIIILGREESKQKTAKFFIKPGFKIKILGPAETKPKDRYQIAKSQALVDPAKQSSSSPNNTVTSKEQPAPGGEEKPADKTGTQPPPTA